MTQLVGLFTLVRQLGQTGDSAVNLLAKAQTAGMDKRPPHELLGLTRRQFLKLLSAATGLGVAGLTATSCSPEDQARWDEILEQIRNRPVRRDIATLAPNDPMIENYKAAIAAMRALPPSDRRNWTRQAQIHLTTCRHRSWLFFPWHRAYLYQFEEICRQLSGNNSFALPYWNWTANPQIPAVFWDTSSPLFHADRSADDKSTASPLLVGPDVVEGLLTQENFLLFAGPAVQLNDPAQFGPANGSVEGTPHNYIHGFVGGTMGTFMSPLDPLFWLHHNRVEQLWVEWNITSEHPNTDNNDWTATEFTEFCDRNGDPVKVSVGEMLLYPLLTYRFDSQMVQ